MAKRNEYGQDTADETMTVEDRQTRAAELQKEREAKAAEEKKAADEEAKRKVLADAAYNAQPRVRLQNAIAQWRTAAKGDIHTRVGQVEALLHELIGVVTPHLPEAQPKEDFHEG